MHSGYKSHKEKISPSMLILMVLHFKTTTKITDRKLLMFAVYVFRSLYLNFGHGTHHIHIIVHVAVFNFLLQFQIAMFNFLLQFFHMCKNVRIRIFEAHNNITHKVV
jgi:hypothetical protein